VVIGVSAGGVDLLMSVLPKLSRGFPVPVVVCLHSGPGTSAELARMLDSRCAVSVKEAEDKEAMSAGTVYLAPGGYHLHLERDKTFSLSVDEPVRYARPSIDVLFDSAAHACRERVLAAVLTGANDDGAQGARRVKAAGGTVIVQEPRSAEVPDMPNAALAVVEPDYRVEPSGLAELLARLCSGGEA
jgi:two-component system, chemotaxis family, protein-glutamate methylesterase/glutaminase